MVMVLNHKVRLAYQPLDSELNGLGRVTAPRWGLSSDVAKSAGFPNRRAVNVGCMAHDEGGIWWWINMGRCALSRVKQVLKDRVDVMRIDSESGYHGILRACAVAIASLCPFDTPLIVQSTSNDLYSAGDTLSVLHQASCQMIPVNLLPATLMQRTARGRLSLFNALFRQNIYILSVEEQASLMRTPVGKF